MSLLLSPLTLRGRTFPNRAWVSPMCQYSCDPGDPGMPTRWHDAHLGSLALGGTGLLVAEATAVSPGARITPFDTGIWTERHGEAWARHVELAHQLGVPMGLQLAHAGRKASTWQTWSDETGNVPLEAGGWPSVAPSAVAFGEYATPQALDRAGIEQVVADFAAAAARAARAGFDVVEVHAAHGYLIHEFLSPLSNRRTDEWGGSWENRTRLVRSVVRAVRAAWPDDRPLFVRLSVTDWAEGGWTLQDSVALASLLGSDGADLIDCSSGGMVPDAPIPATPGYQVPFAREIRHEAGLPVAAVGRISTPEQAEEVLASGAADAVMLGRAFLRDPRWPQRAALALDRPEAVAWPTPYHTAAPSPVV